MWQLLNPTLKIAELDFSGSSHSQVSVTQLWENKTKIINAIEYVNWGDFELQFLVCEVCGYVGCKPQDWISLRRSESLSLIIPAFKTIEEAPKHLKQEYLPPAYLFKNGAYFINQENYVNKLVNIFHFPSLEQLPIISSWEALKLFQFEAPYQVLGHILKTPCLDSEIVIASSEGNFIEQVAHLNRLMENLSNSINSINLRLILEHEKIISFYLDIAGFPEWKALSFDGNQYSLYLEPNYIIEELK